METYRRVSMTKIQLDQKFLFETDIDSNCKWYFQLVYNGGIPNFVIHVFQLAKRVRQYRAIPVIFYDIWSHVNIISKLLKFRNLEAQKKVDLVHLFREK